MGGGGLVSHGQASDSVDLSEKKKKLILTLIHFSSF